MRLTNKFLIMTAVSSGLVSFANTAQANYVGNDPINNMDPTGRETHKTIETYTIGVLGGYTYSKISYVATPRGTKLGEHPIVETGTAIAHGWFVGVGVGGERAQAFCAECGPEDIAGSSAGYDIDIVFGGSVREVSPETRMVPGVGPVKQGGSGKTEYEYSVGLNAGFSLIASENTTITSRNIRADGVLPKAKFREESPGSSSNINYLVDKYDGVKNTGWDRAGGKYKTGSGYEDKTND